MSGGHFNYSGNKIWDMLNEIGTDVAVCKRFPTVARVCRDLGDLLNLTEGVIDWDLSGDSSIDDDRKFDQEFIAKLKKIVGEDIVLANLDEKLNRMKQILDEKII